MKRFAAIIRSKIKKVSENGAEREAEQAMDRSTRRKFEIFPAGVTMRAANRGDRTEGTQLSTKQSGLTTVETQSGYRMKRLWVCASVVEGASGHGRRKSTTSSRVEEAEKTRRARNLSFRS